MITYKMKTVVPFCLQGLLWEWSGNDLLLDKLLYIVPFVTDIGIPFTVEPRGNSGQTYWWNPE